MSTLLGSSDSLVSPVAAPAWKPAPGERVVVYGAGGFARDVVEVIRGAGGVVDHVLDKRRSASPGVSGAETHVPGEEPIEVTQRASMTAVVGVFNRDADPNEIEQILYGLGYGRVVGVPELYEAFAHALGARFWLARRAVYDAAGDRIQAAADLWRDDASRRLYADVLRYRTAWHGATSPGPWPGHQYFPDDVPRTAGPMRFVDCGAFTGDTLASLATIGAPVEQVFAFEPDPGNFAQLLDAGGRFAERTRAKVALWPCAVSDRAGSLRFAGERGEAGHLSPDGDRVVPVVALDEALASEHVTDLKMDIEGAELDALRGAERLVRRCHPRLAICVYHRAEHLWEIPLFVRDLGFEYDYFLRSHGHFGFDVVMYAVPRARG